MKLKKILKEQNKEKWVNILNNKINSGKWKVKDPKVYRGRSSEDKKPVMEKETTGGRKPQDTKELVSILVNTFHKKCYPNFPSRDEVRFGTTDYAYARTFMNRSPGTEGETYVILPSNSTTVYYNPEDPIEIFEKIGSELVYFPSYFEGWFRRKDEKMIDVWKRVPDDFMYLADSLKEFTDNRKIESQLIDELGCVSRLKGVIQSGNEYFNKNPKWVESLKNIIENLEKYFSNLKKGWPEKEKEEDEVVFQGEYLQIENEIYNKWKRQK